MLYCTQIKNFQDFNSRFGYKTDVEGKVLINNNGKAQRKNNVLYQYYKESFKHLHNDDGWPLKFAFEKAEKFNSTDVLFEHLLYVVFNARVSDLCPLKDFDDYIIESNGVCVDGDFSSIRYSKQGHIYKMKIGKYINKYLDTYPTFWSNNPVIRQFFIEELTELWKQKRLAESKMKLIVDDNFAKSYSERYRLSDQRNFNSCMDDKENYHFYTDHTSIFQTVRLEDEEGYVYARANLVNCYDNDGNEHKYLERIYFNKRCYGDLLFEKAKFEKIFDIYKGLTASCHEATKIYSIDDPTQIINYPIHINLCLHEDDYLAYQDTFKYYYSYDNVAYNRPLPNRDYNPLDTTSLYFE